MGCRTRLFLIVTAVALCVGIIDSEQSAAAQSPDLPADAAIVVDAGTGEILYDKRSGQRIDPADLTRLFTAFFALETTPRTHVATISPADIVSDVAEGIEVGDQVTFDTLLSAMLVGGADDAALAAARTLGSEPGLTHRQSVDQFMHRLNARLDEIGLVSTNLVSPYDRGEDGHVSSARDVAALVIYAMRNEPELAARLAAPAVEVEGRIITTQNQTAQVFPGIQGGIAGETASLQIAERNGRTLVAVVLGAFPGSAGDALALQLLEYGFNAPAAAHGRIAFPEETPLVQPTVAGQLAVTPQADGAVRVHSGAPVASDTWQVVKWPLAAFLSMVVLFTCCVQYRAFQRLRQLPPARRRGSRRQPRAVPIPAAPARAAHREEPRDRPVYLPDPGYSSGIAD